MTSVFNGPLAGQIVRTRCPAFDEQIVRRAIDSQTLALKMRHEHARVQAMQALETAIRNEVAQQFRAEHWNPFWDTPYPEPLHRNAVKDFPRGLQEIILFAPGTVANKERFAAALFKVRDVFEQRVAQKLEAYRERTQSQVEEASRRELEALEQRLQAAMARWKSKQGGSLGSGMGSPGSSLFLIPSTTINVISQQPRYFRMLVWNLENFTRDRRPRGAQPMDSMRNQARIELIAHAMAALDVDLLLMMETGTDVGTATSLIAKRVAEIRAKSETNWEPLVSPATGALPKIGTSYLNTAIGRPTGPKALALLTLFDAYRVTPNVANTPAQITGDQIADAWSVLRQTSPEAKRSLAANAVSAQSAMRGAFVSSDLLGARVVAVQQSAGVVAGQLGGNLAADVEVVVRLAGEVTTEIAMGAIQTEPQNLAYGILSARSARATLANVDTNSDQNEAFVDLAVASLEALELLLLFVLKQDLTGRQNKRAEKRAWLQKLRSKNPSPDDLEQIEHAENLLSQDEMQEEMQATLASQVFRTEPETRGQVPLAVFLCTAVQYVDLKALDPVLGPTASGLDNDVLIGALQRLGRIERNVETYGIVYRQPFEGALQDLLERGVFSRGVSEDVDEAAGQYGIVQAPLSGGKQFKVQTPGDPLNWRSALQITVPAAPGVRLPLVVYHTRFTLPKGTEIEEGLNDATNTLLARFMSLWTMADAVLPGDTQMGPPLIVGDFNIPILPVPKKRTKAYKLKLSLYERLRGEMAARSYLRHSTGVDGDAEYPLSTLKAYSTIATGADYMSQPYDGIYQPFDYTAGRVELASGVVQIPALMGDQVMGRNVTGVPSKAATDGAELDVDAGEIATESDDTLMDEAEEPQAPKATWQVLQAISVEVGRVYRSLIRPTFVPLDELMGYIERQLKLPIKPSTPDPGTRRSSRRAAPGLSQVLADSYKALLVEHKRYEVLASARVTWFVQSAAGGNNVTFQQANGADWLTTWRDMLLATAQLADDDGAGTLAEATSTRFQKAAARVEKAHAQLTLLETNEGIRRLIAYRAVVSDHLPQIIEVDLQP